MPQSHYLQLLDSQADRQQGRQTVNNKIKLDFMAIDKKFNMILTLGLSPPSSILEVYIVS